MGHNTSFWSEAIEGRCQALRAREPVTEAAKPVSYTHLTLPTSDLV